MTTLTDDQLRFLERYEVPLSRVYDAAGMSQQEYRTEMSALGMLLAIGVTQCAAAGHSMRTSGGHCAQCDVRQLVFARRAHKVGFVYVAHSDRGALTKIGMANNANARIDTLNSQGYGGIYDWELDFAEHCKDAGRIEYAAQLNLRRQSVSRRFWRQGKMVECLELFQCDVAAAVAEVRRAIQRRT